MIEKDKNREKCSYPMSEFFTYQDEVPDKVRISTPEDCKKCDSFEEKDCTDSRLCLISETQIQMQRKCFNHCPKCNAGENDIEWRDKDWSDESAWQMAECKKCGCVFSEVYIYSFSEIEELPEDLD